MVWPHWRGSALFPLNACRGERRRVWGRAAPIRFIPTFPNIRFGRAVAKSAVRSLFVVLFPVLLKDHTRLPQTPKKLPVKTLVPKLVGSVALHPTSRRRSYRPITAAYSQLGRRDFHPLEHRLLRRTCVPSLSAKSPMPKRTCTPRFSATRSACRSPNTPPTHLDGKQRPLSNARNQASPSSSIWLSMPSTPPWNRRKISRNHSHPSRIPNAGRTPECCLRWTPASARS